MLFAEELYLLSLDQVFKKNSERWSRKAGILTRKHCVLPTENSPTTKCLLNPHLSHQEQMYFYWTHLKLWVFLFLVIF